MKAQITVNITLDTERAKIEAMDMVEGIYNRTEIVEEGFDTPITIREAVRMFHEQLVEYVD